MDSQDSEGEYLIILSGVVEVPIKVTRKQQKPCWSFDLNLEEFQVIERDKNERVLGLREQVGKSFEVSFVRSTNADLKHRVIDYQRHQRLSKTVKKSLESIIEIVSVVKWQT